MTAFTDIAELTIVRLCGWALIHSLWQGLLLTALLAAGLRLLRRRSANGRYLLACAALVALVGLPIATARVMSVAADPGIPEAMATTGTGAHPTQSMPTIVAITPAAPIAETDATVATFEDKPLRWNERLAAAIQPVVPIAGAIWLAGVFVLSVLRAAGFHRLRKVRRSAAALSDPNLAATFAELARNLGVSRPVRLLRSAMMDVPATIGWLRPVVLLPITTLTGLNEHQFRAVLAHELAHIRRYDYLVNLLQTVIESLLFYHPAAWWISRQIRREREHCCDDAATAACGNRLGYARALVALEDLRHRAVPLAVAADGGSLLGRIRRLLGEPSSRGSRTSHWLAGVVTAFIALGLILTIGCVATQAESTPATTAPATDRAEKVTFADDLVFEAYIITRPSSAFTMWLFRQKKLRPEPIEELDTGDPTSASGSHARWRGQQIRPYGS